MPYNPWSGYRMTGTWQDHMSYSLGGEDYPLGYGTALAAPASGTLRTSGGSGEKAAGWIGSAGRRSILDLDQPIGEMASIVFQHQSAFGTHGKHYDEGETLGWSGASANGKDYGGDVHLHVHGLTADGRRVPFTQYIGGSQPAGTANFSKETQALLQEYVTAIGKYSGPIDGALGKNGWRAIQEWLAAVGLYGGAQDGVPGPNTYIGLQRVAQQAGYSGPLDGAPGVNTDAALNTWLKSKLHPAEPFPQPTAGWSAWQTFLREWGYEGPIDNVPGPNTWIALQKFLAAEFGYTGPIDGEPGPKTIEAFNRSAAAGYPHLGQEPEPEEPLPPVTVFPAGETLLTGVDLGTSQKDFDFQKFADAGGDFYIIKFGGGNASDSPYQSPHAKDQLTRGRKVPSLIAGHYWMNGNKGGLTPTSSAQYFARYVPLQEGDLLGLDIEAIDGVPAYTPDEALEFTEEFRKYHPGAVFEIYLNRALINTYDWTPLKEAGHLLWVATLDGTRVPAVGEWEEPSIVQFQIAHTAGGAFDTDLNLAKDLGPARYKRTEVPTEPDVPNTTAILSEYAVKSFALAGEYARKLELPIN
jgi:hypothetical protein